MVKDYVTARAEYDEAEANYYRYGDRSAEAVRALDRCYDQLRATETELLRDTQEIQVCQRQFKKVKKAIKETDLPALRLLAEELKQARTSAT